MGISKHPSIVTMPESKKPYPSILAFLCKRFPAISAEMWEKRISEGKVLDERGHEITRDTLYVPQGRIFYFREVASEPRIPFAEKILCIDDEILVVCKPHFLPVTPGGKYVDECLLNRLRRSTGIADLAPLHRIDRETAGIVLFSVNKKSRGLYGRLFMNGQVEKTYQALSACLPTQETASWNIENRIERGNPWFRMKVVSGSVNARSAIHLTEVKGDTARFTLCPHTGKTHQLRIHMSGLGFGILNDRYYPELQDEREDDFDTPLQLIAQALRFKDPLTGLHREFVSDRELLKTPPSAFMPPPAETDSHFNLTTFTHIRTLLRNHCFGDSGEITMTRYPTQLIACQECDLLQREIPLPTGGEAHCKRCGAMLYRSSPRSLDNSLAFALAAAVLFVIANIYPLLGIEIRDNPNVTHLFGAVRFLWNHDMHLVSSLVCITAIVIPGLEITMIVYLLLPLKFRVVPAGLPLILRVLQNIKPWGMVEVLMLGILVSLIKLKGTSIIIPGVALWSFGGLTLMLAAVASSFNPRDVWIRLEQGSAGERSI